MAPVDSTIIIFDIGQNVAEPDKKDKSSQKKTFFEKAKDCIIRIVERKIISQPKDLVGIILLGSNKTKNNLAEQRSGAFTNIEVFQEAQQPTWEMLRNISDKPTNINADWFEALLVAADYYKYCLHGIQVKQHKIVLMTNFRTPANLGVNVEQVIKDLQDKKYIVTVICPTIYDGTKGDDIQLARHLIETTGGSWATFEDAMGYLLYNKKQNTKPKPWNVDLSFGPNIKIPVSVYGRIRDNIIIKTWKKSVRDPVTEKSSTEVALMKKKEYVNVENKTIVKFEETIPAYLYGQKAIPFSKCDNDMLYKSGCLAVYGFTDADNIKWQNLTGNGVSYLFPRKGDKKAETAIYCLIDCMLEMNIVGIARRVYNNGNAPMMHVLSPIVDGNHLCLSVYGINYKEDIKYMPFPPTNHSKFNCTTEQVDAFKDLIKSMNLMEAYDCSYDDQEAFPIAETVNPAVQHVLDCIAFRAINPGKPLPQPRDDLMVLFKVPPLIEAKSREPLEKIKKMFNLKNLEKPKKEYKKSSSTNNILSSDQNVPDIVSNTDIPKVILPDLKDDIVDIGTVNPIEDFKCLQNKGRLFNSLFKEMIEVLEHMLLLSLNNDNIKQNAIQSLKFLRDECIKNDPTFYNDWFKNFKINLIESKRHNVLDILKKNKLNFITNVENESSVYTNEVEDNDSQEYENNTIPDSAQLTIQSEVNDYFEEM